MRLSLKIATRYLLSKKKLGFINLISSISFIGVAVGTAALILILSVFNGLENLVGSLFGLFDPEIKIEAKNDKFFSIDEKVEKLKKLDNVLVLSFSLEENALLQYNGKEELSIIKGVDEYYYKLNGIDSTLVSGQFLLKQNQSNYAVLGSQIAYNLSASVLGLDPLVIFTPKKGKINLTKAENSFEKMAINISGIFDIEPELNSKYTLVPLSFAQKLTDNEGKVSSIEISVKDKNKLEQTKEKIKELFGPTFYVKNKYEQQEALFKIFKLEKWISFLILSFIILIAAMNLVSSLTMMVIEKKQDLAVIKSFGATERNIKLIFTIIGLFLTFLGALTGLFLGIVVILIQQKFGLVGFDNSASFIVSSYPVEMRASDFLAIIAMVIPLGYLCTLPVTSKIKKITQKEISNL